MCEDENQKRIQDIIAKEGFKLVRAYIAGKIGAYVELYLTGTQDGALGFIATGVSYGAETVWKHREDIHIKTREELNRLLESVDSLAEIAREMWLVEAPEDNGQFLRFFSQEFLDGGKPQARDQVSVMRFASRRERLLFW